jgi:cell wall-associated NlpC family hydrolase
MTYADVVGQMQQIQAQLALLSPAAATTAATSATGASSFADALTTATAATTPTVSTTASTDGTTITANGVTGDDVVSAASKYEGVPYVLGGESTKGMDCSGLVQKTFADLGVSVPRLVHEQQTVGQKVDSLKDAKPGDLIVLNGGDHVAIYAGDGKVIHAPYEGRTVSLQKAWFTDKDIVTIRRVVPSTDDATAATSATTASTSGSTSALSAATVSQATALMSMYGASDGSDSSSDSSSSGSSSSLAGLLGTSSTDSSDSSSSLSSLLATLGASTTDGTSTSTAQQLLAARAALLGAGS